MIRQATQDRLQLPPLGDSERLEQLAFGLHGRAPGLAQLVLAVRCEPDHVTAAILGIALARDKTPSLEAVQKADEVAGVDPQHPPEFKL